MIARLAGKLVEVNLTSVVVEVGGVGYLVYITSKESYTMGESATFYTYLAVRENALDLYGFSKLEEKTMFEHLIKLPKIGPKTALQILSQTDLPTLRKAVQSDDPTYLSKMSGIGKKSAEKIVLGLRDILDEEEYLADATVRGSDTDVIEALLTLGYSERDAREAVQKLPKDIEGTNTRIKYALKQISP